MRPFCNGRKSAVRQQAFSGYEKWRLVIRDQYKYVRGWDQESMLFDLDNDPMENENLASAKPRLAAELVNLLD